jgi:hypothetical protein
MRTSSPHEAKRNAGLVLPQLKSPDVALLYPGYEKMHGRDEPGHDIVERFR